MVWCLKAVRDQQLVSEPKGDPFFQSKTSDLLKITRLFIKNLERESRSGGFLERETRSDFKKIIRSTTTNTKSQQNNNIFVIYKLRSTRKEEEIIKSVTFSHT